MKRLYFLFLVVPLWLAVKAQQSPSLAAATKTQVRVTGLRALTLGDYVPDFTFAHLLNYPARQARLSGFKAKLVILDFWNTHCGSCIELFPHMESLQKEFDGQLQVLLVDGHSVICHDDSIAISKTLATTEGIFNVKVDLPVVYNSLEMDSSFEYTSVPHEVWLDESGKVIAITRQEDVNERNIKIVLNGGSLSKVHMKLEGYLDWSSGIQSKNYQQLIDEAGLPNRPLFTSSLYKGFIDGPQAFSGVRPDTLHRGLFFGLYLTNTSLLDLCMRAYEGVFKESKNQIQLLVKDSLGFVNVTDTGVSNMFSWYENSWTYDLVGLSMSREKMNDFLRADLSRYLGLELTVREIPWDCIVINGGRVKEKSSSKGGTPYFTLFGPAWHGARNLSVGDVIRSLNGRSSVPLVDSTGSNFAIDMAFPEDITNKAELIVALKKAGFDVTEETKVMTVAVIKQD